MMGMEYTQEAKQDGLQITSDKELELKFLTSSWMDVGVALDAAADWLTRPLSASPPSPPRAPPRVPKVGQARIALSRPAPPLAP